jgi:ubiquinol-cytochrome c reductase cytochrome c1 subunit
MTTMPASRLLAAAALAAALLPVPAAANTAGVRLDAAPVNLNNKASLQRGAQLFVNHCLNCHSAAAMRYSRLTDLGLTEQQIRENLMFASEKIGEPMVSVLDPKDAKVAFGVVPPDLSLSARSRGADWIYTYLRSFYRDPATRTGWNNTVFPNVGMPHVLWELQGTQALEVHTAKDEHSGESHQTRRLHLETPGRLTPVQYDEEVGHLVNFMAWLGEPSQVNRKLWGVIAMFVLGLLVIATKLLKTEYWKDVR